MTKPIFPESAAWVASLPPALKSFNDASKERDEYCLYASLDMTKLGDAHSRNPRPQPHH